MKEGGYQQLGMNSAHVFAALCCSCLHLLPLQSNAQLIYKMTRDGALPADFYRCCAGKGPTLVLIKVSGSQQSCARLMSGGDLKRSAVC